MFKGQAGNDHCFLLHAISLSLPFLLLRLTKTSHILHKYCLPSSIWPREFLTTLTINRRIANMALKVRILSVLNQKIYSIISIIIALNLLAIVAAALSDNVKNFDNCITSDVIYTNSDDPTEKYKVAKITRQELGKSWIEMKIEKDMDLKFSWKKNGGKDTDLLFYLKKATDEDFQETASCKGYENCIDENWTKSDESYSVMKGDVVRWGLWIRSSNFKNGRGLIAVHGKDLIPENMKPSNPQLNISSANIIVGEPLCISATSDDQDDEQIEYSFDWNGHIEEAGFFRAGVPATACNSWNVPGAYTVRARATDVRSKASDWSDALIVNVKEAPTLLLSTPMLVGPSAADVDSESVYKVTRIKGLEGIRYQFEWDGELEESRSGDEFRHTWLTSGKKTVRVRAVDGQYSMSEWSLPTMTIVYQTVEVGSSDPLTNIINNSSNFTKFILEDENYLLSSEIRLSNKSYIIIEPNCENCILRAQPTLERIIMLINSDNITIRNLRCGNARTTIKLYDCSHCSIEGCTFDFGICMYGIRLISTDNISIQNNLLIYDGNYCDATSRAIAVHINGVKDSLISNNEINRTGHNLPICYFVEQGNDICRNITIKLPITNTGKIYSIKYNDCAAEWNYNDGITNATCHIPNNGSRGEWII